MTEIKKNGSFVSEKISKIRWIPEQQYADAKTFITGSWGNSGNNTLKLWKLIRNEYSDDENEYIPKSEAKLSFYGDVTGLEMIDFNHIAVSSSSGFVSIIELNRNLEIDNLREVHRFKNIEKCTSISICETNIASVGESGILNVLSSKEKKVIRTIDPADSISLTSVSFINFNEIITGNRMGLLKMFDVRSESNKPTTNFPISCQDDKKSNSVTSITYHPTQKHVVLAGSEEGSITVWDLRQPNSAASYFTAHSMPITEIKFHQTQPSKLFTASENGELWQWNQNSVTLSSNDFVDPWLSGERSKNKFNVTSLIDGIRKSVNSFDSFDSKIICGCDNEAIYLIENMY